MIFDEDKTIFPTHSCFNDAMELIDYVLCKKVLPYWMLVHGICVTPDEQEYAHAWVEDPVLEVAMFAAILKSEKQYFASPIKEFYKVLQIKETTKYSMKEAMRHNIETVSYGPWEEKYKILCGKEAVPMGSAGELQMTPIGALPERKT